MAPSSLEIIHNFRAVDERLCTSGQPSEAQLADIAAACFTTVINLGLHDDARYSLPDERATVLALGLTYVHIPVQFKTPTQADLQAFFDAMQDHAEDKLWVHCAANIRVSAFLGLYRVIHQGWAPEQAFKLMHGLWKTDAIWSAFIANTLKRYQSHTVAAEVIGIDHVYITVSDLARSEAFYDMALQQTLGFRKNSFTLGGDPHIQYYNRMFGFVLRPARVATPHEPYAPGLHHFCLRVNTIAEVKAVAARLRDSGIAATEEKLYPDYAPDYSATFFEDPDGLRLEVTNYRQERRDRHDHWHPAAK